MWSTLDDELQDALKEYLIAKGIGVSLTNFLLHYLHKREHEQYMNWLKKGEAAFVAKEGSLRESSELHSWLMCTHLLVNIFESSENDLVVW